MTSEKTAAAFTSFYEQVKKMEKPDKENTLTDEDFTVILKSSLFNGMEEKELRILLNCLSVQKKTYRKDELIIRSGEHISGIGLLLTGSAHIERYDYWGNRSIVSAILPGDFFGESYAASMQETANINVRADGLMSALFLDIGRVLHMCTNSCPFHAKLIDNFVSLLAFRNLRLNEKLTYLSQHTLRDKLLVYLSNESQKQHSSYFDIPFNRQQLADYLNAERSALSSELSKMKKEGIIDFQKNHFRLLITIPENH